MSNLQLAVQDVPGYTDNKIPLDSFNFIGDYQLSKRDEQKLARARNTRGEIYLPDSGAIVESLPTNSPFTNKPTLYWLGKAVDTAKGIYQFYTDKIQPVVDPLFSTPKQCSVTMAPKKSIRKAGKKVAATPVTTIGRGRTNNPSLTMLTAPVSMGTTVSRPRNKPSVTSTSQGVVIKHAELASAVVAASDATYRCLNFIANAGSSGLTPWLSNVATSYEKYRFRSITLRYVPMCSTASAGRVGIGFDYDSSDPVPGDRTEFFSLTSQMTSAVWAPCSLSIKTDNVFRFVGTHYSTDNKLVDLGQVLVYTEGTTSSLACGDLIMEYEVELIMPQQALYNTQSVKSTAYSTTTMMGNSNLVSTAGPRVVSSFYYSDARTIKIGLPPGNFIIFIDVTAANVGDSDCAVAGTGATVDKKIWRSTGVQAVLVEINTPVSTDITFVYGASTTFNVSTAAFFLASRVSRPNLDLLDW